MANTNETTNAYIKNVQLYWLKLDKPVAPFGTEQYELQIRVPKKRSKELEAFGTVKAVKDDSTMVQLNMKKKAFKSDGSPAAKIKCLSTVKGEEYDPRTVGNGSVGTVKVMLRDYEITGPNGKVTKRGTQVTPVAIQVTEYKKYEAQSKDDGFEFSDEGEGSPTDDNDQF